MDDLEKIEIAAWSDGFWIPSLDDAKDVDQAGAFSCGDHKVISVYSGCSEADIQNAIVAAFSMDEVAA